ERKGTGDAPGGRTDLHAERAADDLDRLRRGRCPRHEPLVRPLQRLDEWHRDVRRWPLSGSGSHCHADLRARLQQGVHPVLLLQRIIRVPLPATREPSQGSHPRRRTHEGIRKELIRAVVFDFDGVIANSEPLHFRGFQDVLAGLGHTLTEAQYYETYLGYDDASAFEAMLNDRGVKV